MLGDRLRDATDLRREIIVILVVQNIFHRITVGTVVDVTLDIFPEHEATTLILTMLEVVDDVLDSFEHVSLAD